jgi:alanine-synthesizing transaminase
MPDPEELHRIKRLPPYVFPEVAVTPGIGFGEYGERFVRIGLVENEHRIRQAARGVRRLMQRADEIVSQHRQSEEAIS